MTALVESADKLEYLGVFQAYGDMVFDVWSDKEGCVHVDGPGGVDEPELARRTVPCRRPVEAPRSRSLKKNIPPGPPTPAGLARTLLTRDGCEASLYDLLSSIATTMSGFAALDVFRHRFPCARCGCSSGRLYRIKSKAMRIYCARCTTVMRDA